jgi:hypothetical protein
MAVAVPVPETETRDSSDLIKQYVAFSKIR